MQVTAPEARVRLGEASGRWVIFAAVLGSGMAMLDATVVNVALPALGAELGAGIDGLQWTLNSYTLTLASFILLGGSLGDRFGRRRIFIIGTVWFAAASLLCGVAPSIELLVASRALQGVGGALLTPGSLALIGALFQGEERGRARGDHHPRRGREIGRAEGRPAAAPLTCPLRRGRPGSGSVQWLTSAYLACGPGGAKKV